MEQNVTLEVRVIFFKVLINKKNLYIYYLKNALRKIVLKMVGIFFLNVQFYQFFCLSYCPRIVRGKCDAILKRRRQE